MPSPISLAFSPKEKRRPLCCKTSYKICGKRSSEDGSKEKSTYENVVVIVANKDQSPEFAFKQAQGGEDDVVFCPPEIF